MNTGWICPICNTVNAPTVSQCPSIHTRPNYPPPTIWPNPNAECTCTFNAAPSGNCPKHGPWTRPVITYRSLNS